MSSLNLKCAATLALVVLVPAACAPTSGGGSFTPSTLSAAARTPQGGGGGGGGGGVVPPPAPNVCEPWPGTCVLTAQMYPSFQIQNNGNPPKPAGASQGTMRFERSPQRIAVTTTVHIKPPAPLFTVGVGVFDRVPSQWLQYQAVGIMGLGVNSLGGPANVAAIAARGTIDPLGNLSLQTLPGDGLLSHRINSVPDDPAISAYHAAWCNTFASFYQETAAQCIGQGVAIAQPPDLSAPPAADLAILEAAKAGTFVFVGDAGGGSSWSVGILQ